MTAGEWVRKAPSTAQRRMAGARVSGAQRPMRQMLASLIAVLRWALTRYWLKRRMTAHQYASTWFEWLGKENTWRMDLRQITVYDALRVGQYVDQSSSRGLEKFGSDILTSSEVIRAEKLRVGSSSMAIFASFNRYIFRTFTFKATIIIL